LGFFGWAGIVWPFPLLHSSLDCGTVPNGRDRPRFAELNVVRQTDPGALAPNISPGQLRPPNQER
jgi:hypothetical protein